MAAFLLLVVAAAVALGGFDPTADSSGDALRARGWAPLDHVECAGIRAGSFYEVNGEQGSAEIFAAGSLLLASRVPLPDPPYDCRPIREPHFVEEI